MGYVVYFDIASFILMLVLYCANKLSNRFPSRTNRIFNIFIFVSLFSAFLNILTVYTPVYFPLSLLWLNNILAVAHIACVNILPVIYFMFIISITHELIHFSKKHFLIIGIAAAFELISVATSPVTHFVMYFDELGQYHHGPGMTALYIMAAFFILLNFIEIIHYRAKVSLISFFLVSGYSFLLIIATIIQFFNPHLLVIGFAIAISLFLIFLSLQNPLDYIDKATGTYNVAALKEYHFSTRAFKHECSFGIVHISNFDSVSQTFGVENSFKILRKKIELVKKELNVKYVFNIYKNCFMVLDKNPQAIREKLERLININKHKEETVRASGDKNHVHLQIETMILENFDINRLKKSTYELISPIDKLLQIILFVASAEKEKDVITKIDDSYINKYEELQEITTYVNRAIATNSFEVHLQPIFDLHEKKFTSAESLIRLRDNDGNYISPSVFIPLAEQNGRIFEIGDISIRKTCEFIKEGKIPELGVTKININLSMNQCMQENIVNHLCSILDEYGIDKNLIRFEVTETIMAKSSEYFGTVIKSMKEKGIDFVVDDYGTGYSNTSRLLSYPFAEIKFDKSLIDAASESEKNAKSLKYLIAMIKNSGQIVLAEGVESKAMSDLLESYGCDLIQGYFYSKPLALDDFVATVSKFNLIDGNK